MAKHRKIGEHTVTFTFETKEVLEDFLAWFCDGGGEQGWHSDGPEYPNFDYSRCFPAWGWKEGEPRFVDCEFSYDYDAKEEE